MAVSANSYGSADDVAELVPKWANNGRFDDTTEPTLARVETLIDNVSAIANGCLAQMGYDVPVTDTDAVRIVKQLVSETTATIVDGIRGTGRYAPGSKAVQRNGMMTVVYTDICNMLKGMDFGLQQLGATKTIQNADGIGFRDEDEGGDETAPIFQRNAFGNAFKDWDD